MCTAGTLQCKNAPYAYVFKDVNMDVNFEEFIKHPMKATSMMQERTRYGNEFIW